ncbi:MAG: GNAT family N-acetyltransferase [Ruminococcaceae bacterium]|nr:GNAT family N-acetyltransferase [Oscillospiraceae bacterium]
MEIRFAKPEDTMAILKLLEQIGKVHYDLRPDIFQFHAQKYGASQVLDRLANPETPTFVAVEGEEVLGYSFCEIKTFSQHPVMADRKEMFLEDLCVDENARGQGVGKALYEYVCKIAREIGCHNLTLHVWSDNAGAVAFYEKMGMKSQRYIMETVLEES